MSVKRYPEQDPVALDKAGGYYMRHVHAMTVEALHGKSEIAEQLGWRDQRIDALEAEVAGLRKQAGDYQAALSSADRDLRAYIGIATKCAELEDLLRRASKDLAMWNMGLANEINAALKAAQGGE